MNAGAATWPLPRWGAMAPELSAARALACRRCQFPGGTGGVGIIGGTTGPGAGGAGDGIGTGTGIEMTC